MSERVMRMIASLTDEEAAAALEAIILRRQEIRKERVCEIVKALNAITNKADDMNIPIRIDTNDGEFVHSFFYDEALDAIRMVQHYA